MEDSSDNIRFKNGITASFAMSKGEVRAQMEDNIDIANFSISNKQYFAFCVFDGHCATRKDPHISAVGYAKQNFIPFLQKQLLENNIRLAIEQTFLLLDHDLQDEDSGTTVSLLLIVEEPNQKRQVWVANCGDSSVFGFGKNPEKIQKLSVDHKPHLKSEMKRMQIKSKSNKMKFKVDDGYVVNGDGDALAMTRSLGDSSFQDFITSKPSISRIHQQFDVIMVASDGLHDCMSGKHIWEFIKHKNPIGVAKQLLDYRNDKFEQHDNVSIVIVYL